MNHDPDDVSQELTDEAQYFDYSSASNPLLQKLIAPTPYHTFTPEFLHGDTAGVLPLDLSAQLQCDYPATSPALLANFVRIINGTVTTSAPATSQVFYVFEGRGHTEAFGRTIPWEAGDYLAFPAHGEAAHHCDGKASFYWVHDGPLVTYLGVTAATQRFAPTVYKHTLAAAKLQQIADDPRGRLANRVSVLLANKKFPHTRTITHTMWAMFGLLPKGAIRELLPKRVVLAPRVSGPKMADVVALLERAIDNIGDDDFDMAGEAMQVLAGNPAVVSLDTLDIDLGTSRLRASGQLAVASAEDVTGKAEVRMTGLDALMRALGKVPEAAMAAPVMLMLKGMGEQKGAETVWRVTYAANKVLVNGQDLSALLSGGWSLGSAGGWATGLTRACRGFAIRHLRSKRLVLEARERAATRVNRCVLQFFFDAKQLVVFSNALAASRCTGLDLAGVGCNC
jgi:hypothetical protein